MFEELKKKERSRMASPGRAGRSLIPGLGVADPKLRVLMLVGLLVILGVALVLLRSFSSTPQARTVTDAVPSRAIGATTVFSGVPTLDRAYLEDVSDATPKDQGVWPERAVTYLFAEANTPAVFAYRRNLLPVWAGNAQEILADPDPWKFQFVRFRGAIETMAEGEYVDVFGGDEAVGRVHYGRVLLASEGGGEEAARVTFVTTALPLFQDPNEPDAETEIITDGWVRGRGIFVKVYRDVLGDGREVPTFLVVVTKLERDYETVEVKARADIPFQIIDDDPTYLLKDDERGKKVMQKTYPRPLFRLVRFAADRAGEEGAALRAKDLEEHGDTEPADFNDNKVYETFLLQPARHRMRYIRGLGATAMDTLSVGPENFPEQSVNDAGIEEYVTGWLYTDSEKLIQFVAPASLDLGWKQKTRVRFEGYFYKTQAYIARSTEDRMVPFVVLTVLEEVKPVPLDPTGQILIAAGFVVGIALLIFIIVREDKTKDSYRRLHRLRSKRTT